MYVLLDWFSLSNFCSVSYKYGHSLFFYRNIPIVPLWVIRYVTIMLYITYHHHSLLYPYILSWMLQGWSLFSSNGSWLQKLFHLWTAYLSDRLPPYPSMWVSSSFIFICKHFFYLAAYFLRMETWKYSRTKGTFQGSNHFISLFLVCHCIS